MRKPKIKARNKPTVLLRGAQIFYIEEEIPVGTKIGTLDVNNGVMKSINNLSFRIIHPKSGNTQSVKSKNHSLYKLI